MKTTPVIRDQWLPYVERLQPRSLDAIDMVVIHCTELPDLATARSWGERIVHPSGTGNSGHYYIDRDGKIFCYVPEARIAHHVRGCNERSLGIELVNVGRYPDWLDSRRQTMTEAYPPVQVEALLTLLEQLRARLPNLSHIAGHAELDTDMVAASDDASLQVHRKLDPGPMFPWTQVLRACPLRRLEPAAPQV